MNLEIDLIRLDDGTAGHVKQYGQFFSEVFINDGHEEYTMMVDNDDFIVVHTISMEYKEE